jgi:hypothetical protein
VYTHEKVKNQLRGEWDNLMEHVREVNRDLDDRFYAQSLTFDLDTAQDRLKVMVGDQPASTYTQGANNIYFDIDIDSDRIAAITIRNVSEYMKTKAQDHVWMSLLDILRLVKTIEVPPMAKGDSGRDKFAQELRGLILA